MIPVNDTAYQLLHEGALALERAENIGMHIDTAYCERQDRKITRKIGFYEKKFQQTKTGRLWNHIYGANMNWASDKQLRSVLFDKLKLEPHKYTDKGNPSLDDESLEALGDQAKGVHYISKLRRLQKTRNTYIRAMLREQVDGVLRPFFQFHPATYRSSSSHINFQNIPKRDQEMMQIVRRAIYTRPGHQILAIDFSGIEVRTSEFYHHDPVMREYILDPESNMHRDLAIQIFMLDSLDKDHSGEKKLYNGSKNGFVFPQFYGDYYGNNAKSLWKWGELKDSKIKPTDGVELKDGTKVGEHLISKGIKTYQDFEEHVKDVEDDFWNRRFRVYQQWKEELIEFYNENGYVEMHTGFRSTGVLAKNQVINLPIQGTAFHLLLKSFIELDKQLVKKNYKSRLMGQIHDELLVSTHPDELDKVIKMARRIISKKLPKIWPWINVPLDVEAELCPVNKPWSEKEPFNIKEAA